VDDDWWQENQLAVSALEAGQRKGALAVARLLAEIYPTWSRAFVTLGRALAASGDLRGAPSAGDGAATRSVRDPRDRVESPAEVTRE
jgi:Flp pilus assembly protein TadD